MDIDVFISYTHRDNKPVGNENKESEGWITRFHHYLNIRLGELLGRDPSIWRDFKLQGNDEFDDEIMVELHRAKVLVAVVSPGYLNSEWCIKELTQFLKTGNGSRYLNLGTKSRVFKVLKTFVPPPDHPGEIRGTLGYEFFHFDQEKDRSPHEFIPVTDSPTYYKFRQKLDDLAWDIHSLLETIDKQTQHPEGQPLPPPPKMSSPEKTVYLAETSYDLREERENIQRSLKQKGYTVLPDRQLPLFLKDGNIQDDIREYLERCKLSIHLVGNICGAVPEGEDQSIIDLQNQAAMEQCKKNQLKQLILIPPDLEKNKRKEHWENYINRLRIDAPRVGGVELLETGLEDFKTVIRDTLEKINSPPPVREEITPGVPRVYLICDENDLKDIKPVDDCLYDGGFEVIKPIFKGDVSERREMHKEYLSLCDAMMIYFNRANEYWLHTKLNDLRKAPAFRKAKPLKAGAVFITGQKTDEKETFRTREANVIREYEPHFCDVLLPFVSKVKE